MAFDLDFLRVRPSASEREGAERTADAPQPAEDPEGTPTASDIVVKRWMDALVERQSELEALDDLTRKTTGRAPSSRVGSIQAATLYRPVADMDNGEYILEAMGLALEPSVVETAEASSDVETPVEREGKRPQTGRLFGLLSRAGD